MHASQFGRQAQPLSPDRLLEQATCAVLVNDTLTGTGWLYNHLGYVLTAGHVIEHEQSSVPIYVSFLNEQPQPATIVYSLYEPWKELDFAILKLKTPTERQPLPLVFDRGSGKTFMTRGYGKTLRYMSSADGKIVGPYYPGDRTEFKLLELSGEHLAEAGFSGCAIFSNELNGVVAIQIRLADLTLPNTVLALPIERINAVFSLTLPAKQVQLCYSYMDNDWVQRKIHPFLTENEIKYSSVLTNAVSKNTVLESPYTWFILPPDQAGLLDWPSLADIFSGQDMLLERRKRYILRRSSQVMIPDELGLFYCAEIWGSRTIDQALEPLVSRTQTTFLTIQYPNRFLRFLEEEIRMGRFQYFNELPEDKPQQPVNLWAIFYLSQQAQQAADLARSVADLRLKISGNNQLTMNAVGRTRQQLNLIMEQLEQLSSLLSIADKANLGRKQTGEVRDAIDEVIQQGSNVEKEFSAALLNPKAFPRFRNELLDLHYSLDTLSESLSTFNQALKKDAKITQ